MSPIIHALSISLIPFFVVWIAITSTFAKFSKGTATSIQATAAGFILGSILIDLMPRILQQGFHFSYIISFVIGFGLMLALQQNSSGCCGGGKSKKSLMSFLVPFGVEFFVTGLLIGITAATSTTLVLLIAISFSLCNLICSLSISARLSADNVSRGYRTGTTTILSLLILFGALIGSATIDSVPLSWVNDLLSFSIACLLSLLLTDLIPEGTSHNKQRGVTIIFSAVTFVFLLYYLI